MHMYINSDLYFQDRNGHGPEFQKHMNRINKESGTRITVSIVKYLTFG